MIRVSLTCPNDKLPGEEINWKRIKNRNQKATADYRKLFEGNRRSPPLQTIKYESKYTVPTELEYGIYYLRPPFCDRLHSEDNQYGNATSMLVYLRYGVHSVLLPGDITPEAMQSVLHQTEAAEKRFTTFSKFQNS